MYIYHVRFSSLEVRESDAIALFESNDVPYTASLCDKLYGFNFVAKKQYEPQ